VLVTASPGIVGIKNKEQRAPSLIDLAFYNNVNAAFVLTTEKYRYIEYIPFVSYVRHINSTGTVLKQYRYLLRPQEYWTTKSIYKYGRTFNIFKREKLLAIYEQNSLSLFEEGIVRNRVFLIYDGITVGTYRLIVREWDIY
jgi:hypothetical protein